MAKKKEQKFTPYLANTGLGDDKTGTTVKPDQPVPAGIFSDEVLANWLEIGAIRLAEGEAE